MVSKAYFLLRSNLAYFVTCVCVCVSSVYVRTHASDLVSVFANGLVQLPALTHAGRTGRA